MNLVSQHKLKIKQRWHLTIKLYHKFPRTCLLDKD